MKKRIYSGIAVEAGDLELSTYDYSLPEGLIALHPAEERHLSKLLVYDLQKDEIIHDSMKNIGDYLPHDSLLVFNESKVFPSRLFLEKNSGGKGECLLLHANPKVHSRLKDSSNRDLNVYHALLKYRGEKKIGDKLFVLHPFTQEKVGELEVLEIPSTTRGIEEFQITFSESMKNPLEYCSIPLPPYIRKGIANAEDFERYQTTYAKNIGSVAAPTAGLHFSKELLNDLKQRGIKNAFVNLHVGIGTFRPIKADQIINHRMHEEEFFIEDLEYQKIAHHQEKIFAVGTTSLRVLETLLREGPQKKSTTGIFLYPGESIESVDGLLTNFHLPKSSLLLLVSAMIGRKNTMKIYEEAIRKDYRFFSYGDAMLIKR